MKPAINETRVELAAELVCSKVTLSIINKLSVYFHPWSLLIPDHILRKGSFHFCWPVFHFFLSPFTHMVHLSYLFPLSFLINILKCFCQENFSYKGSKHPISLQKAMTVKNSWDRHSRKHHLKWSNRASLRKSYIITWFENGIFLNNGAGNVTPHHKSCLYRIFRYYLQNISLSREKH